MAVQYSIHKLTPYIVLHYSIRNDSLFLADINGKKYANRIKELNDKTLALDGIADVKEEQMFER